MNFTKKEITNFILIFVLGGIGGVFFSDILLPKFSIFSGITQKGEQTVIVQKTEKVSVEEQEILSNIIKKNSESLVVIKNLKNNS
ncbi:hypothetical protein HY249_01520, partial [Candidatus Azambacteria bacterium]|nr:hypothetical protein [Candidatus Azambacteria bacterium]